MPSEHEPDPRFQENLEWQLSGELRRLNRSGGNHRLSIRVLKVAALMLVSIGVGAGAMRASHQLQESWKKELLETRLAVQLEIAQHRVQVQSEAIEQIREDVRLGLRQPLELEQEEFQIAQAESMADLMQLILEEIRQSGQEPLGQLSSPLVGDRDFVSERIQLQMQVARRNLESMQDLAEKMRSDTQTGTADDIDLKGWDLSARGAELEVEALTKRLEVREAYINSEITAVEAELKVLEVEAQNRITLLTQQRELYASELDEFREMEEAGTTVPAYARHVRMYHADIEQRLRLAETELGIIRRELERRAGSH